MEFCRTSSHARSFIALSLLFNAGLIGCAHSPKNRDSKAPETATGTPLVAETKPEELSAQEQLQKLREKITDLETRIGALNEKVNLQNGAAPAQDIAMTSAKDHVNESSEAHTKELPTQQVRHPPAAARVIPTSKTPVKFAHDENIDRYREAKILFDSGRFTDATVEFVSFTKEAPDHALAPAAQYFVGMGYFKQKEFSRAEEEFNRGLVSYPHSNFVPDTLLSLIEVSLALKKTGRVTYYQQKLSSTFPNSPQALKAALIGNHPETDSPREEKPVMIARPAAPEAPAFPEMPAAPKSDEEKP